MKKETYDMEAAYEVAKKEEIPYSHFLQAFFFEEILRTLEEKPGGKKCLLRNEQDLQPEAYRRKMAKGLYFYYLGPLNETWNYSLMQMFTQDEEGPIIWKIKAIEKTMQKAMVTLEATFQEKSYPITLFFTALLQEAVQPASCKIPLYFSEKKEVTLPTYPREEELTESFFEIMTKMELLSEMAHYERIYEILHEEPVNGRHMREKIQKIAEEKHMAVEEKRMQSIVGYADYAYMQKKWKRYLRGENKKTPEWREVMKVFQNFFQPIWEVICRDEVFFGDWMPELERFM